MNQGWGLSGFIIGSILAQFAGAWAYWRTRIVLTDRARRELWAASIAGVVTALVGTVAYIFFKVHLWLDVQNAPWGADVFLGICMGICQAVLFRGRPLTQLFINREKAHSSSGSGNRAA